MGTRGSAVGASTGCLPPAAITGYRNLQGVTINIVGMNATRIAGNLNSQNFSYMILEPFVDIEVGLG